MNEVCISKLLFRETSLRIAIDAYASIATIMYEDYPDCWALSFSKCRYDIRRSIREFENYLLSIEATNGETDHDSV